MTISEENLSRLSVLAILGLIIGLFLVMFLCNGCATTTRTYKLPACTVIVTPAYAIPGGRTGCYVPITETIYVRPGWGTDRDGELLPDFETLGHEVWHAVKGPWHMSETEVTP